MFAALACVVSLGCAVEAGSSSSIENEDLGTSRAALSTQLNAPWHLDRLNQSSLPLDTVYSYVKNGAGSTVYILSTGIHLHPDYVARLGAGFTNGFPNGDPIGTGTQLAGLVGGTVFGVAKQATIRSVTVHGAAPPTDAALISGMQWVLNQHITNGGPAVVLFDTPIEANASASVRNAVLTLVNYNMHVVLPVAANATIPSMGSNMGLINVAATDVNDTAMWGPSGPALVTLDIRAPGAGLTTTHNNSSTITVSGTAMSAAIVAGMAATYIGVGPGGGGPFKQALLSSASTIPSTAIDGKRLARLTW